MAIREAAAHRDARLRAECRDAPRRTVLLEQRRCAVRRRVCPVSAAFPECAGQHSAAPCLMALHLQAAGPVARA